MLLSRRFQEVLTVLCGAALAISFFSSSPIFPYSAVLFGSYFAFKAAWGSLKDRSIDVNFLMVFAGAGSVAIGRPQEAAVLLFLFSLSSSLESMAMAKTRNAIEGLIKLRPDTALLVVDGEPDRTVAVKDLHIGDRVRVLPYDHVPADGKIVLGSTTIDQHAMTGESIPVPKEPGDMALAASQNLESMFVLEVTTAAGDTTIEKIVDLVRDAQENKASGERISQWFGQSYTIFVIGAFCVALALRLLFKQPFSDAIYASLTLLVALSPCALVISTPASTLSALAWCARNGILVRGGQFIEFAGAIDVVALDKTGTLTKGQPSLAEMCVCSGVSTVASATGRLCVDDDACWHEGATLSTESARALRFAAAAEQYSTHPIAEAIVSRARELSVDIPEALDVSTHSGLGVSATIDGVPVRVGQRRFFESEGQTIDPDFAVHVDELQRKGMTVAILEAEGRFAALGLIDEPRPEAQRFLSELREIGVKEIVLLTGDNQQTADAIAAKLNLTAPRAGLLPADKTEIVDAFENAKKRVMMVGDGVNDAPSLSRASVGVAMAGLGSDIALNAADVALMQDRLDGIPKLMRLGRKANGIIRANLLFATGVILTLTIGSQVLDFAAPELRRFLLPFAVIGHEGSTVLVILNGLRLLRGP